MKILITGVAGFIGSAVARRLVADGHSVIGLDNLNETADKSLKYLRLGHLLGVSHDDILPGVSIPSRRDSNFHFVKMNLEDASRMERLFSENDFEIVIHLAARTGVRDSADSPITYVRSNVDGFLNVLEGCRLAGVRHLVYASSSSVYGLNGKTPFSEHDGIAHPVSLYAATKKSNELMAHAYSSLYRLPTTGLRLFTVYGPWGRPDMSPYLFIDAILHDRPVKVFNAGDMLRDFTYIDDIVEGIVRVMEIIPEADNNWDAATSDPATSSAPYRIYNIGSQRPVKLIDYIRCIENVAGRKAVMELLPMQPGDVHTTHADTSALEAATGFRPSTPLQQGIEATVKWLKDYQASARASRH